MLPHAQAVTLDAVVTTMYRITVVVAVWCFTACPPNLLYARDDGRFADSPLKEWFEHLRSPAVVWPYQDRDGTTRIRCFIPGAGT